MADDAPEIEQPKKKRGNPNPNLGPAVAAKKINEARRHEEMRKIILHAVSQVGTSATNLARFLKVERGTVYTRCRKLGIDLDELKQQIKAAPEGTSLEDALKIELPSKLPRTILELFDLLLPYFREDADERTWIAWRVFLAAAFGLPCPEDKPDVVYPGCPADDVPRGEGAIPAGASNVQIFAICTGRSSWPEKQFKEVSLVVGRRGGKSFITAIIGIFLACCREYKLGIGEQGMVQILARDKDQARVIRGYILALLRAVPQLAATLQGEPTQKLIELNNGITIEIRAANDSGVRGYTVVGALLDEIAFWKTDENSARPDKAILRAIRPAMSRTKGAMLVMLSSPYARKGEFYEAHRKGYGKDENRRVLVWQADSLSMHPTDDPELLDEIREAYADDPESAKAEYGASFRSDLESIYSKEAIQAVAVSGRVEQGYIEGTRYRAFVDPSGGSSDSMTLAIAHTEDRETGQLDAKGRKVTETYEILDAIRERKAPFSPDDVVEEFTTLLKQYKVSAVTGDRYAGEWAREPFRKKGIKYKLSDRTRSELYLELLPLINSKRCELLDANRHLRMTNQFTNLERRPGRGKDVVDHPPGGHDDVSNAVAGVLVCTADPGNGLRIRSGEAVVSESSPDDKAAAEAIEVERDALIPREHRKDLNSVLRWIIGNLPAQERTIEVVRREFRELSDANAIGFEWNSRVALKFLGVMA